MATKLAQSQAPKTVAKLTGKVPNFTKLESVVKSLVELEGNIVDTYRKLGQAAQELKDRFDVSDLDILKHLDSVGISFSRAKLSRARKIYNLDLSGAEAEATISGRGMTVKDETKVHTDKLTDEEKLQAKIDRDAKRIIETYSESEMSLLFQTVQKLLVLKREQTSK